MADTSAPVDLGTLLAHGRFVRALARDLVGDAHLADDLTQETWCAALRHPPRRGVRGWLRAVVRNLALNVRRDAKRRDAREQHGALRGAAPSAHELCARAEILRRIAAAVLDLDEPYRATVLLRFYDGLTPQQIGRLQCVPASTVRTRLQRAIARLRAKLGDDERSRRDAWCAAPVLGSTTRPRAPAAAAPLAVAGGALMAKSSSVAAAVLFLAVLAAGAYLVAPRAPHGAQHGSTAPPDPRREPSSVPRAERTAEEIETGADAPGAGSTGTAGVADSTPVASPPHRWRLDGRLAGLDPADAGRAEIVVTAIRAWDAPGADAPAVRASSGGVFDLDVTALAESAGARELEIRIEHPRALPAVARVQLGSAEPRASGAERGLRTEIRLVRASPLRGSVVDGRGVPVAGAAVGAFPATADGTDEQPVDRATSDASGVFVIRLGPGGRHVVAAGRAGLRPAIAEVRGEPGELAPLVLRDGEHVAGTVTWNGRPAAATRVEVRPAATLAPHLQLGDVSIEGSGDDAVVLPAVAVAAADGTFRIAGLPRGAWRLRWLGPAEGRVLADVYEWSERAAAAPSEGVMLDVSTSLLRVDVRADGKPVAAASLSITGTTPEDESIECGAGCGADGGWTGSVRPGAEYEVEARANGRSPSSRRIRAAAAGQESREVFELPPQEPPEPRVLRIVFRGDGAELLSDASVGFFAPGSTAAEPEDATPALAVKDGRCDVAGPPVGAYRIVVRPGGPWHGNTSFWADAETTVDVPSAGVAVADVPLRSAGRLRIAARDPEGRIVSARCVVRDAEGRRVPVRFLTRTPGGWSAGSGRLGSDGPSAVEPALAAGDYRVEVSDDRFVARTEDVRVDAGRWTDVELALTRR